MESTEKQKLILKLNIIKKSILDAKGDLKKLSLIKYELAKLRSSQEKNPEEIIFVLLSDVYEEVGLFYNTKGKKGNLNKAINNLNQILIHELS